MTGLLDSQTIQTCMEFHVWRSMESLCISGMMRAEIRHDGLDREANSEAVGSKVNSRFYNWVGYCIEHVFELLFFLQGTGISNFFGILGCKVQATTDKRKTLGVACEVATEWFFVPDSNWLTTFFWHPRFGLDEASAATSSEFSLRPPTNAWNNGPLGKRFGPHCTIFKGKKMSFYKMQLTLRTRSHIALTDSTLSGD